jgi:hypothetical protein
VDASYWRPELPLVSASMRVELFTGSPVEQLTCWTAG